LKKPAAEKISNFFKNPKFGKILAMKKFWEFLENRTGLLRRTALATPCATAQGLKRSRRGAFK